MRSTAYHLQLGQDAKAKAMLEQAASTADTGTRVVTFVNFTALAEKLVTLAQHADTLRPEIAPAKAFLGQR